MPKQISLLGHKCEVQQTPPLPTTEEKPGVALVFTDKEAPHDSVVVTMSKETANRISEELAQDHEDKLKSDLVIVR